MTDRNAYTQLVPVWAAACAGLPQFLWPLAATLVALRWIVSAMSSPRRVGEVVNAISLACQTSQRDASWIFFRSLIHNAENTIYFAALQRLSDDELVTWADKRTEFLNLAELSSSGSGKPVILLLGSFALHYYGLMPASRFQDSYPPTVRVVQPTVALDPLNRIGYYEQISRAFGLSISGIFADTPSVAIHIARAVRDGAVVAMRIDSLPTETMQFVESRLCGRPSMFPLSVLQLASRLGATLVPFTVVRKGGRFVTQLHQSVSMPRNPGTEDFMNAAAAIDEQIGAMLRLYPEQYTAWHAVVEKWRMADEIRLLVANAEQ